MSIPPVDEKTTANLSDSGPSMWEGRHCKVQLIVCEESLYCLTSFPHKLATYCTFYGSASPDGIGD